MHWLFMISKFLDFLPEKNKIILIRVKRMENIEKDLQDLGFSRISENADIWELDTIKFRLIPDFGTVEATDLIAVNTDKAKVLVTILKKKRGFYLSHHEAVNAGLTNQIYTINEDKKTQFLLMAVGDFELEEKDIRQVTSLLFPLNITEMDYNVLALKIDAKTLKRFDYFAVTFKANVFCHCQPCLNMNSIEKIGDIRVPLIKLYLEVLYLLELIEKNNPISDLDDISTYLDKFSATVSDWDDVLTQQGYFRCKCKPCVANESDFIDYDNQGLNDIYQKIVKLALVNMKKSPMREVPLKDKGFYLETNHHLFQVA